MRFYLDTNVIVSLFFPDPLSERADLWLEQEKRPLVVSIWSETELYALTHRRIRGGSLAVAAAQVALRSFDAFANTNAERLPHSAAAGARAATLARDPALKLSAADALHLALSHDAGHCLTTFDSRLAEAARILRYDVEIP